jgi:MFS family permease
VPEPPYPAAHSPATSASPAPPPPHPGPDGPAVSTGSRGPTGSIRAKVGDLLALTSPAVPLISLLARLPAAMAFIGTLLLVTATTGSVGTAGIVAGSLGIGQAAAAPLLGRLADRAGHRPTLLLTGLTNAAALCALVVAVGAGAPLAVQVGVAALTGASVQPISALARIRWVVLAGRRHPAGTGPDGNEPDQTITAPGPGTDTTVPGAERTDPAPRQRLIGTAMSVEGVLDEISFVGGPAIAGVLAALVHPVAVPIAAAVLVAVFGVLFARHSIAAPPRRAERRATSRLPPARLAVPLSLMLLQGMVFGAGQAGVTALTGRIGEPGLAGIVWAVLGVTSAAASLGMVAVPDRFDLPGRLRGATLGLSLLALPLLVVDGLAGLLLAIAGLGAGIAPHVITVFGLTERITPADRAAEAMTLLVSAVIVGNAAGAMLGGRLADASGHTAAFAVLGTAAASALVIALLFGRARWYGRHVTPSVAGDKVRP